MVYTIFLLILYHLIMTDVVIEFQQTIYLYIYIHYSW